MSGDMDLRSAIVEVARRTRAEGLVTGTSGNVSARSGEGFLLTPTGVPYERLTPDMVVPTALDGAFEGSWRPSSEWRLHADIYRARADVGAVVHTHSPHATAVSTLRFDIPAFHYMVAAAGGDVIRCATYSTFGTQALSDAMLEALGDRRACLLANHGVVAIGADLDRALDLAIEVEGLARQYLLARAAGEPVILDANEMGRVLAAFRGYGQPRRR